MKKTLIFMTFSMLFCMTLFGQHKVEYDFMTKNPPAITFAKIGTTSVFKINNINKFLYEVKIESSQSEYNSEVPAIFSTIFKFETKEGSTLKYEADKVIENSSESKENKEKALLYGITQAKLFKELEKYSSLNEDLKVLFDKPDSMKIFELSKTIEDLKKHIKVQEEEFTRLIDDEYLKKAIEIQVNGRIVSEAFEQLEETKTIKNKLIRMTLTDGLDYKKASDRIYQLKSDYPYILNPEKLLTSFQRSYTNFKASVILYSVDLAVKKHFENNDSKLKESTTGLTNEIEDIKKKVDKFDYTKLFEEINQLITELNNETNYFISSDPVQAKKDVINYSVKISPRKGVESLSALENRNFNIEIPINGGLKIDFSTGLFVTTNLNERRYSINASTADTSLSIITKDKNNSIARLTLGALMHVSPRCIGQFKPGFTFGLGLNSTDLSNAHIYIGGSAMFGSQERFIISSGVSLANIDYLNSKYSLNTPIKNPEIVNTLTEKSLRAGCFISFTYNLTNKMKE